jgi:opacity protein-like surface antigen
MKTSFLPYGAFAFLFIILGAAGYTEDTKLPVFYLKYDASLGSEETEEDIEQSSYRHTVSLRIKEQFSRSFTTNVLTTYSRKEYLLEKGSYSYVAVNPYITYDITDKLRWYQGVRSKWVTFDETDSDGDSKDFTSLFFNSKLVFKPIDAIKLTPSVKGVYDLFENEEKTRQTYTFGFAIDTKIDNVRVGGRYRAIARLPLAEESTVMRRFSNEFGASLSWDPNK